MPDIDVNGRGDVKPSTDSSLRDLNPVNNPFGEFQHNIFDANYDHSPYTSFNGSGASSGSGAGLGSDTPVHPFKLERFNLALSPFKNSPVAKTYDDATLAPPPTTIPL